MGCVHLLLFLTTARHLRGALVPTLSQMVWNDEYSRAVDRLVFGILIFVCNFLSRELTRRKFFFDYPYDKK